MVSLITRNFAISGVHTCEFDHESEFCVQLLARLVLLGGRIKLLVQQNVADSLQHGFRLIRLDAVVNQALCGLFSLVSSMFTTIIIRVLLFLIFYLFRFLCVKPFSEKFRVKQGIVMVINCSFSVLFANKKAGPPKR